ncbi:RapZ C-terminal domain-containing protein [Plebeiibacterium sediminum]|uniref:Phosphotransferase n=1 Tax=Plebeiibacterium sediminum TaxID=2992112 RepID=A0AAE3M1E5_9BACT|nr:RNase adapter RapZ [Plebeiobacterium sediminum]MCW3785344.1 phosphotransferase [Plebeiobacterium sediminum]
MKLEKQQLLMEMFTQWSGEKVESLSLLPPSGSYREYVRICGGDKCALGVFNEDEKENRAFIGFTEHFYARGLKVPQVFSQNLNEGIYLIEDLGRTTLFDFLQENRTGEEMSPELIELYKKTLKELIQFQLKGTEGLDFDLCYPRKAFDRQSMLWDLHYFKYYFLKLAQVAFDEQALEDDFNKLIEFLLDAEHDYFLYRDFQSRNVMVKQGEPWFIDYQGGRKGALQYDLASLLYDGKADISPLMRDELLAFYIDELKKNKEVDEELFKQHFSGYVYIRIMQAMGAYGFRGFYEKKEHFLKSIPFALQNISYLLKNKPLSIDVPELNRVLGSLVNNERLKQINALTVTINSFSYKRGIPFDMSGNGGGFVFDCRAIHNPGRYPEYKHITGKDEPVIEFLSKEPEMKQFLDSVFSLVSQSVEKYIERNFKHLMVNFGCTGGQHRSVYSAEQLAQYLSAKYPVTVKIRHIEQEIKKA